MTQLLITWKPDGYIRWLRGLGQQYTDRRDHLIDLLHEKFHIHTSTSGHDLWKGCAVYDAYPKAGRLGEKFGQTKYFSFVAPSGGMFIWVRALCASDRQLGLTHIQLKFYFDSHPEFSKKPVESLEMRLWQEFTNAGVLVAPGWCFSADQEHIPDGKYEGHYRISFSTATVSVCLHRSLEHLTHMFELPDMKKGVDIMAEVMKSFLGGE